MSFRRSHLGHLWVLAIVLLAGCTFARSEINNKDIPELTKNVKLGVTKSRELVDMIGTPPGQVILLPTGGRLLIYNYGESKTKGLTLIVLNIAKTNLAIDTAIFRINKDDVIEESWVGNNSSDVPWQWWAFGS